MTFLRKFFGGSGSTRKNQPSAATIEDLCHRFPLAQLRKCTNNFDESRIIGRGYSGVVYRAYITIDGQLKDLSLTRFCRVGVNILSEEHSLLKDNIIYRCLLHHPNLVSLVGFCDEGDAVFVAYDYSPHGSLHHLLYGQERNSNSPIVSWKKRLEISIGVARGLHYLHSGIKRTIIHFSVTSDDILLYENWVPKLTFTGFSLKGAKFSKKDMQPVEVKANVQVTYGHVAPELHLPGPNATEKCDVYSFGSLLFQLICGKTLRRIMVKPHGRNLYSPLIHVNMAVHDLAEKKKAKEIIDERMVGEIAEECWELYMEIIQSCLSEDPKERPHMGEVEVQLERTLQLQQEADANRALHAFFF